MKQNKRRTATVVYIFIFMLTVSGCVRKGKEQDKVYQETGMFEWSEEAVCEPEEALYLAKELGITKWYQETNGMTEVEATGKFVKALHNRKIEVYALLGAVEWGYEEDGATLLAHLEKIVQYNVQSSEKEKFDGVMLDIEPYISDSWKENPEEYMDRYISCMKKGYKFAQKNHLRTAICIPRHYDNQGLTSGLEELIKETCDEVAVMKSRQSEQRLRFLKNTERSYIAYWSFRRLESMVLQKIKLIGIRESTMRKRLGRNFRRNIKI